MRALHLVLAIGAIVMLSTPVRTQQRRPAALKAGGAEKPRAGETGVTSGTAPATISGNALTATNTKLPHAPVRLRDARKGGIVSEQRTDESGLFVFQPVLPGIYVVELKGDLGTVLAASDLVPVGAGESASTIVQLHDRTTPVGLTSAYQKSALLAVLSSAATVGVLTSAPTTDVSGETPKIP
jgi:hypothetical protein